MNTNLKLGDLVYDKADPRHIGRVTKRSGTQGGGPAILVDILWLETRWRSLNVRVDDLVRVLTREEAAQFKELDDAKLARVCVLWYVHEQTA